MPTDPPSAYRIWSLACPFRKNGTPVLGTFGRTIESVVLMRHSTFKRLIAEHPTLATAQFEVGEETDGDR